MTKSKAAAKYKYRLLFLPSALKELQDLDGSVREPMRNLFRKRLNNPNVPGGALRGGLQGYYKIKLKEHGFRLVYGVEDDALIVVVMAVDKREDSVVYRSAVARIVEKVPVLANAIGKKLAG